MYRPPRSLEAISQPRPSGAGAPCSSWELTLTGTAAPYVPPPPPAPVTGTRPVTSRLFEAIPANHSPPAHRASRDVTWAASGGCRHGTASVQDRDRPPLLGCPGPRPPLSTEPARRGRHRTGESHCTQDAAKPAGPPQETLHVRKRGPRRHRRSWTDVAGPRELKLCALNVQSFKPKSVVLRDEIERFSYDFVAVSETWLKPITPNRLLAFPSSSDVIDPGPHEGTAVWLYCIARNISKRPS